MNSDDSPILIIRKKGTIQIAVCMGRTIEFASKQFELYDFKKNSPIRKKLDLADTKKKLDSLLYILTDFPDEEKKSLIDFVQVLNSSNDDDEFYVQIHYQLP